MLISKRIKMYFFELFKSLKRMIFQRQDDRRKVNKKRSKDDSIYVAYAYMKIRKGFSNEICMMMEWKIVKKYADLHVAKIKISCVRKWMYQTTESIFLFFLFHYLFRLFFFWATYMQANLRKKKFHFIVLCWWCGGEAKRHSF